MYSWRIMTDKEREEALRLRKLKNYPWHNPPHKDFGEGHYHLTAACFEHKPIIGFNFERISEFEESLLTTVKKYSEEIIAWCILPNHYHLLINTYDIKMAIKFIGRLHGQTSYRWNGEENQRGRKVWYNCVERVLTTDRHIYATLNYIHNNPVHHKYVSLWQDWPYSSAARFIENVGRERASEIWIKYPLLDYGKGWDEPNL